MPEISFAKLKKRFAFPNANYKTTILVKVHS